MPVNAPFTIHRVSTTDIHVSPEALDFERDNADAIGANWRAASTAQPALFNGTVHLCVSAGVNGDALTAICHAVRFATLLYWRRQTDKAGLRNTFGDVILRGSDGAVLLGRMAGHTANAGRWCLPGGSFDQNDVVDGRIDPTGCIGRECAEETGLQPGDYSLDPHLLVYRDDRVVAYSQVATLHSSSDEARARVLRFLDSDPGSELADIRLVRSVADAEALIPDTYEARLIAHVFSEDAR